LLAPTGQVIPDDRECRQGDSMAADFTPRQGQFLAFIYYYTKIHRIPPAETDMRRFFRISPPAVHEMVKTLERHGFITREPGKPRTIRVLLPKDELPDLE
ncbi:MAG: LexA family protein, partial [Isosphaeraceae bacterium]